MNALMAVLLMATVHGTDAAVDQIGTPAYSAVTTAPQVGTPVRTVPPATVAPKTSAASQLSNNRPSAAAPPSGSTRKQGRDTHTEALQGTDNCDPQNGQADEACKRVIETRSDEFSPPPSEPLSAEQSLMVSQQKTDSGRDVTAATRRLANGDIDDSNAGLAVSVMGTTTSSTDDPTAKVESNSTTDAIVSAVVNLVQGATK
jgi:hypothetical protein